MIHETNTDTTANPACTYFSGELIPPAPTSRNPTATRLAIAAPSRTTSAMSLVGSSRRAWLAVSAGLSRHTVSHTHRPKTSARTSHPTSGASSRAPATIATAPPPTATTSATSSLVRARDPANAWDLPGGSGFMSSDSRAARLAGRAYHQ